MHLYAYIAFICIKRFLTANHPLEVVEYVQNNGLISLLHIGLIKQVHKKHNSIC